MCSGLFISNILCWLDNLVIVPFIFYKIVCDFSAPRYSFSCTWVLKQYVCCFFLFLVIAIDFCLDVILSVHF